MAFKAQMEFNLTYHRRELTGKRNWKKTKPQVKPGEQR